MKTIKIIGISIGSIVSIAFIALIIFGSMIPETFIYLGRQVPKEYLNEIRSLGLLSEGEQLKYFYTDGLFNIKDGMYFVTDRNLVIYCSDWEKPDEIIGFNEIVKIEPEFDDSFFNDSMVFIETASGMQLTFPLSSEKGRDKVFVEYLKQQSKVEQSE